MRFYVFFKGKRRIMKKYIFMFLVFFINFSFSEEVDWVKDYKKAFIIAKNENKNVFVFFNSSKEPFCSKKNDEKEFLKKINSFFVLVDIDISEEALFNQNFIQNKNLKKTYKIEEVPFVFILDEEEHVITKQSYSSLLERGSENLLKRLADYNDFKKQKFSYLNIDDLIENYEKVKSLGFEGLKIKIIQEGMKNIEDPFFRLEQYALLLNNNDLMEAEELKKEIIANDPNNLKKGHLKLALIDFEFFAKDTRIKDPEVVIKPLVEYINLFGKKDKRDIWFLEMTISHFFNKKGLLKEALLHARVSYKTAPVSLRKDIAKIVLCLKKKVKNPSNISCQK
jgi:hypothetical protein